jgi:Zn-dependent metalloprotease
MGTAFEFAYYCLTGESENTADWVLGENSLTDANYIRNMADPHDREDSEKYGWEDPYWYAVENCDPQSGCSNPNDNDNCGIHTNSGVMNRWFYLLGWEEPRMMLPLQASEWMMR